MSELEIPNLPWFPVKKVIQKLREMKMLEWICYLRPVYPGKVQETSLQPPPTLPIHTLQCLPPLPQKLTIYGKWILIAVIKLT